MCTNGSAGARRLRVRRRDGCEAYSVVMRGLDPRIPILALDACLNEMAGT
jgi:hypothetical protein